MAESKEKQGPQIPVTNCLLVSTVFVLYVYICYVPEKKCTCFDLASRLRGQWQCRMILTVYQHLMLVVSAHLGPTTWTDVCVSGILSE